MERCVRWLTCVVGVFWLWAFAPTAVAWAAPELPDLVPKDGSGRYYAYTEPGDLPRLKLKDGSPLPLRETKVKAKLTGLVAEVEVRQTYVNKSKKAIEAVYAFPLPENSAVNDMKIVVGKRVIRAQIRERAAAKQVYENAKKSGLTAALLEQERPNVFTQSVANIAPGHDIDVVVTYVQDLTYDAGTYEFVFPMVVGERYVSGTPTNWAPVGTGTAADTDKVPDASRVTPPVAAKGTRTGKDISIAVSVDAGSRIRSYKVPTHAVTGGLDADGRLAVKLEKKTSIPNRDFVLRYRVAQPSVASTVFLDGDDEGGHFTLVVQPPDVDVDDLVGARELVFVDVSGSMQGQPLAMCKVAMRRAISALRPLDTFNIVTFAGHTALAFDEPRPANDTNIRAATQFVDGLRGGGGTEILDAVDTVLAPDVGSGRHRYVFFMTDGYVAIEEEVGARISGWLKGLRAQGQKARVFSFGVGSSVNRELLETLARAGKGVAVYATKGDDPRRGVAKFFRYIDRAVWTDLKVDWGMDVLDLHPAEPPDLFASRAAVIHGRYRGPPSAGGEAAGEARQEEGGHDREGAGVDDLPEDREDAVGPCPRARLDRRQRDRPECVVREGDHQARPRPPPRHAIHELRRRRPFTRRQQGEPAARRPGRRQGRRGPEPQRPEWNVAARGRRHRRCWWCHVRRRRRARTDVSQGRTPRVRRSGARNRGAPRHGGLRSLPRGRGRWPVVPHPRVRRPPPAETDAMKSLALLGLLAGCSGSPELAPQPPAFEPEGQTKCGVRASAAKPLIVEWPSAERGELEARSRDGAVVVRYDSCEMEVLPNCSLRAAYRFQAFTPKRDNVVIHNEDELWARIPVGAARLEGKLARYGQLTVEMTMVGRYTLDTPTVPRAALHGDCQDATHVVSAATVGAFEFFAGRAGQVGASVEVGNAGAGAQRSRSHETLTQDGDPTACAAEGAAGGPPLQCGAFIRLEVTPLSAASPPPQPSTPPSSPVERRPFNYDRTDPDPDTGWREVD